MKKTRLNITAFQGSNQLEDLTSLAARINGGADLNLFDLASFLKTRLVTYPSSLEGVGYSLSENRLNVFKEGKKTEADPDPVPTSLLIIEEVEVFDIVREDKA